MLVRFGLCGAVTALAVALMIAPGVSSAQGLDTGQGAAGGGVGQRGMGGAGGTELPGSVDSMRYDPFAEYQNGLADLQAGKFAKADGEFSHVLQGDANNADTLYMQGKAKTGEGDLKGAERSYEKALKVDPQMISALRESALTLAKLGQSDKAQAQLAVLKARTDACGGACPHASALKDAMAAVEAALSPAAPTAGHG